MIRIALICLLISLVESNNCTFNQTQILELQKSLLDATSYMAVNGGDQVAAICIGTARAGKSTLVNYLIGNKLIGFKPSKFESIKMKRADNKAEGPEIGMGSTSKTKIPKKYSSIELNNLAIWDSAGFGDNRGEIQDITNAFYLYQLVKGVESLKFILVINFGDILSENIIPFLSLLRTLENFFGDKFKSVFSSIVVIFSKAPFKLDDYSINYEFLNYKLEAQFLNSTNLAITNDSKGFIKYIIEHNNRVAFFRTAEVVGPIPFNVTENIYTAIRSTSSLNKNLLNGIGLTISDQSAICLRNAKDKLMPLDIQPLSSAIDEFFHNKNNEISKIYQTNQTNQINHELEEIQKMLYHPSNSHLNLEKKIENLKNINDSVKTVIKNYTLIEKIKLISFIDSILNLNHTGLLEYRVEYIYIDVYKEIKSLMTNIQLLTKKITRDLYQQEINKLNNDYTVKVCQLELEIKRLEKELNSGLYNWLISLFKTDKTASYKMECPIGNIDV